MAACHRTVRPSDVDPRPAGREQIARKSVGDNGAGEIVRQRGDLLRRERETRDRGGQWSPQRSRAGLHVFSAEDRLLEVAMVAFEPVEDRPEIALQHRALQRIVDQLFAVRIDEFGEQRDRLPVRGSLQQVLRPDPQKRIDTVAAVLAAVRSDADEQRRVKTVPQVFAVVVVRPHRRRRRRDAHDLQRDGRCGDSARTDHGSSYDFSVRTQILR